MLFLVPRFQGLNSRTSPWIVQAESANALVGSRLCARAWSCTSFTPFLWQLVSIQCTRCPFNYHVHWNHQCRQNLTKKGQWDFSKVHLIFPIEASSQNLRWDPHLLRPHQRNLFLLTDPTSLSRWEMYHPIGDFNYNFWKRSRNWLFIGRNNL